MIFQLKVTNAFNKPFNDGNQEQPDFTPKIYLSQNVTSYNKDISLITKVAESSRTKGYGGMDAGGFIYLNISGNSPYAAGG